LIKSTFTLSGVNSSKEASESRHALGYAYDPIKTFWANRDLDWFERCVGRYLPPSFPQLTIHFSRIGIVEEGGGKRRIFAIGHSFEIRGPVPRLVDGNSPSFTDRWFNQERRTFAPVKRFSDVYYCYDERYGSVAVNIVNDNHVNLFGPILASSVSRLHHGGITLSQCYPSRQLSAL
jgi:hypothetical protein